MRTLYHRELDRVRETIQKMGGLVDIATQRAITALVNRDLELAREVKREDRTTDALRYSVETACLTLMATQQPVARDLRELTSASMVAVELERCGDYAKGVAKAARRICRANSDIGAYGLREMDVIVRDMLKRSVQAFVAEDAVAAHAIIQDDNIVDRMYDELLMQVTTDMTTNPTHIEGGTWVLHAGHCLERLADRATNIAERIIFIDSGSMPGDLNVHDADETRKLEL
jgi:phosphate transport system protein